MQSHDDIDDSVLRDLEGLGWGTREDLQRKLLRRTEDSLQSLEYVFYQLLAARRESQRREVRVTDTRTLVD